MPISWLAKTEEKLMLPLEMQIVRTVCDASRAVVEKVVERLKHLVDVGLGCNG